MRPIIAKITLDNRVGIIEAHPDSIDYLTNFFTVIDTSECWVYGKFRKELAKPVSFITHSKNNPTGALIPIGLIPTLEKVLIKLKAKYKIIDDRKYEKWNFTDDEISNILYNESNPIILRDYQVNAIKQMLKYKNGIVKGATGMGKGEIFSAWVKLTNKKTLIAFKNIKLAREIVTRMKKANINIGLVQGTNIDEEHQVVAITVQSAHKLNRTDYEAIIVDENHNASQERYQQLLKRYDFEYRFGFSATPFNKNKLKTYKVKSWLGDIIYDQPAKELIDKGYLAKPVITFLRVNKVINNVKRQKTTKLTDEEGNFLRDDKGNILKEKKVWYEKVEKDIYDKKWSTVERQGIVYNVYRNKMIKTLANSLPGTVLALVKYVDSHGVKLHKDIEDALFLSGQNKVEERELAVEMLEGNKIKTIIASTIFDEGISINNISNILICGGGQSYFKTLQRIGRGMRLNYDEDGNVIKNTVRVFDFYDETNPILERHSKARIKYAEEEGYKIKIKDINISI